MRWQLSLNSGASGQVLDEEPEALASFWRVGEQPLPTDSDRCPVSRDRKHPSTPTQAELYGDVTSDLFAGGHHPGWP